MNLRETDKGDLMFVTWMLILIMAFLVLLAGFQLLRIARSGPSKLKGHTAVAFSIIYDGKQDDTYRIPVSDTDFIAVSEMTISGKQYIDNHLATGTSIPGEVDIHIGEWHFHSHGDCFPDPKLHNFDNRLFAEAPYMDTSSGEPVMPERKLVVRVSVETISKQDWATFQSKMKTESTEGTK